MEEKKTLQDISHWEKSKPSEATFFRVSFKLRKVSKVIGTFRNHSCIWDGFGNAYHSLTMKRFPSADIKLS